MVKQPNRDRLHVLFVNTRSALGADVAVHLDLIRHFDPARVQISIATNRNADDLEALLNLLRPFPHVRILVCDLGHEVAGHSGGKAAKLRGMTKNAGALASLARLAWFVRVHKVSILHATDRPRDALFSMLLARLTGRPNIIHLHIKWMPEQAGRATRLAIDRSPAVLAISQFVRHSLRDGGVPEPKIYTALNATDATHFDPANTKRRLLRNRFGLSDDTPLIGIVARVIVWKGHQELISALAKVREAIPDVRLAIVGKEDASDTANPDGYANGLRKQIGELGLTDAVLWTGWQEDAPGVMADLDVLAMPSWEEPFGLVVTEAMAMERPVVGFASGALPEIVRDGVDGLLVPPKDVNALADALISLLRNPARREAMGKAGRARVLEKFIPRRQADEVEQIYRRILARQPDEPTEAK